MSGCTDSAARPSSGFSIHQRTTMLFTRSLAVAFVSLLALVVDARPVTDTTYFTRRLREWKLNLLAISGDGAHNLRVREGDGRGSGGVAGALLDFINAAAAMANGVNGSGSGTANGVAPVIGNGVIGGGGNGVASSG